MKDLNNERLNLQDLGESTEDISEELHTPYSPDLKKVMRGEVLDIDNVLPHTP